MQARRVSVLSKVEVQARYNQDALQKVAQRVELEGASESVIVNAKARALAANTEWRFSKKRLDSGRAKLQKVNRIVFLSTRKVSNTGANCVKATIRSESVHKAAQIQLEALCIAKTKSMAQNCAAVLACNNLDGGNRAMPVCSFEWSRSNM